jgi:hypothetical protein
VAAISVSNLAGALCSVGAMGLQKRGELADRIHADQPTLLYRCW